MYIHKQRQYVVLAGLWGTVCSDSWDMNEATVVCRQLGFKEAIAPAINSIFGQGSGLPIWMDEVNCTGTEHRLEVLVRLLYTETA